MVISIVASPEIDAFAQAIAPLELVHVGGLFVLERWQKRFAENHRAIGNWLTLAVKGDTIRVVDNRKRQHQKNYPVPEELKSLHDASFAQLSLDRVGKLPDLLLGLQYPSADLGVLPIERNEEPYLTKEQITTWFLDNLALTHDAPLRGQGYRKDQETYTFFSRSYNNDADTCKKWIGQQGLSHVVSVYYSCFDSDFQLKVDDYDVATGRIAYKGFFIDYGDPNAFGDRGGFNVYDSSGRMIVLVKDNVWPFYPWEMAVCRKVSSIKAWIDSGFGPLEGVAGYVLAKDRGEVREWLSAEKELQHHRKKRLSLETAVEKLNANRVKF